MVVVVVVAVVAVVAVLMAVLAVRVVWVVPVAVATMTSRGVSSGPLIPGATFFPVRPPGPQAVPGIIPAVPTQQSAVRGCFLQCHRFSV